MNKKNVIAQVISRTDLRNSSVEATEADLQKITETLTGEGETTTAVVDVPYSGARYIVLETIKERGGFDKNIPLFVKTNFPGINDQEEVLSRIDDMGWTGRENKLTTQDVAEFFRSRSNGAIDTEGTSLVPAAAESFACCTIGGDIGASIMTTEDEEWESNYYEYYDLLDVPVGGSIYRVSSTQTLWMFTRRDNSHWEVTIVPSPSWATTTYHDGNQSIGSLLDGALSLYRQINPVPTRLRRRHQ